MKWKQCCVQEQTAPPAVRSCSLILRTDVTEVLTQLHASVVQLNGADHRCHYLNLLFSCSEDSQLSTEELYYNDIRH